MTKFEPKKSLESAMKITDEEDAKQYLKEYIKYIQDAIDNDPQRIGENAEEIAKSNLGYYAGYYSNIVRERVERLFVCKHPFFGSIAKGEVSSEDAFKMGERLGVKIARKKKLNNINKNN